MKVLITFKESSVKYMGEIIWVILKVFIYSMLVYGFVLYVSDFAKKDKTIPTIIIASIVALFFFWANLG